MEQLGVPGQLLMIFPSRQAKFSAGAVRPNIPTPVTTPLLSVYAKHAEVSRIPAAETRLELG